MNVVGTPYVHDVRAMNKRRSPVITPPSSIRNTVRVIFKTCYRRTKVGELPDWDPCSWAQDSRGAHASTKCTTIILFQVSKYVAAQTQSMYL